MKVVIAPNDVIIQKNTNIVLTVDIQPDNASNKTITWNTGDENVATVSNGVVTAVGLGSTTITATSKEGVIGTCNIIVGPYKTYSVGEAITLNNAGTDETFYVMKESSAIDSQLTLLARDQVNSTTLKQDSTAPTRAFSSSAYWVDELNGYSGLIDINDLGKEAEGDAIGVAKRYAKQINTNAKGRLITYEEAQDLEVVNANLLHGREGYSTNGGCNTWTSSVGMPAGDIPSVQRVSVNLGDIEGRGWYNTVVARIRPVIEISKSLI